MKKFTVTIDDCQIPVYLGNITDRMVMRFGRTGDEFHRHECSISAISDFWLTSEGIYGGCLNMMVYNYLKFTGKRPGYIYITDDEDISNYYPTTSISIDYALGNNVDYTTVTHIEEK